MSNKEQKMEKARKTDKSPVDPHREFLDMDTDEEEFGRQESSETEEELPAEPIKPVYDEQDLNELVQHVKDLTVLPSIKDSDWCEDCLAIIREYFENPKHAFLSVYFNGSTLKARLSVPEECPSGLVYFLRTPWHVFTVENFHATVIFGSVNRNVTMCVLKVMENMYVPIALNSDEWPEIIRNHLFYNLHNFLICLTERVYKPMGLTKLYVSREKLPNISTSSANEKSDLSESSGEERIKALNESEKALINRYEGIVRCWIKQIREVLAYTSSNESRQTVYDELQYWTAIYFDLCCLHDQLSNEEIQSILRLLENIRSPSVDSFHVLTIQLHEGLEQATSNMMYLKVLSDACDDLKCPKEIEAPIAKILLLILFIWTESPFYNMPSNVEVLCQAVSAQVVRQCKEYIDLEALLEGDTENGIKMLEKCIDCCRTYKTIYDKVTSITMHIKSNRDWSVNDRIVFNSIDTFTQRCNDVIEICNALIVFGRRNKVGMIGSAKGTQYEAYCCRVEDLFYESLEEVKLVRNNILDVTKSTWLENMQKFRDSVTELENMIKTLIDRIFKEVKNIEEGIEAIYALQRFKHRESLRDMLSTKWIQVWKMFGKEIASCDRNMTSRETYHPLFQRHSENTATLCIARYLERLFRMMIDASDWLGDCAGQKYILEQYKQVTNVIDKRKSLSEF